MTVIKFGGAINVFKACPDRYILKCDNFKFNPCIFEGDIIPDPDQYRTTPVDIQLNVIR